MKNTKNNQTYQTSAGSKELPPKVKKRRRTAKIVFVAVVAALSVGAIVGLSVALYYSQDKIYTQAKYQREMESVYSRAYYDLLDGANDIDITMSKLSAASTNEKKQALLYELWSTAQLAETNLAAFEGGDEGVQAATKFVNQLGDYSLYLARKLADGQNIEEGELQTLDKLKPMAGVLKNALQTVGDGLDEGRLFLDEQGLIDNFSSAFSEFTEPSLDYPEMIYDGPFSDALESRTAKGLENEAEITDAEGQSQIDKLFDGASEITFVGRYDGRIPTLNYSFMQNGRQAYVQLSVKGGKVVNFNISPVDGVGADGEKDAGNKAIAFATKLGFENMQVVWSASANGLVFVNLAPVVNGIILYPDLVKVKIDSSSGEIVGLDSSHYAYNHTLRKMPSPKLTQNEARAKITLGEVSEGRLALIPQGETREQLCYEFECEQNGTYFIYIDAQTGKEADILYVIDSAQGSVLM